MAIQVQAENLNLGDVVEGMGTVVHINTTQIVFDKPQNELLYTHYYSADDEFTIDDAVIQNTLCEPCVQWEPGMAL